MFSLVLIKRYKNLSPTEQNCLSTNRQHKEKRHKTRYKILSKEFNLDYNENRQQEEKT